MENKHERGAARFGEFVDAITSLTRKILEDVGDDQMKQIFTDCLNSNKDPERAKPMKDSRLKKMRQALIDTPLPYIKADIEEAFADLNVNEKFQLLVELQDKYRNRKTKAWRPPADPHQHMAGFRVAAKRELLDKWGIFVSMKRNQVDQLKEQFKNLKTSSDLCRAEAELMEVNHTLEAIHDLNSRFNQSHERVVERMAEEISKNTAHCF